jgi:hypothetical protein
MVLKQFLSIGHDEYWSWDMRAHVEAARNNGVSLGFFTANTCYWQIRFEPDSIGAPNRTVVCYKDSFMEDPLYPADPRRGTTLWRHPDAANRPEGALMGVQFGSCCFVGEDLVIFDASHWICHGTGLHNNDVLPGLVGNEVDALYTGADAPSNIAIIARSPWPDPDVPYSDFVAYTATSGATVVSTGTFEWSWALDDYGADASVGPAVRPSVLSSAAQRMTLNILYHFIGAKWVDFGHSGIETGRINQPFNTLSEAVTAVPARGCVIMMPGFSNERLTISKAMTLQASSGVVSIGL